MCWQGLPKANLISEIDRLFPSLGSSFPGTSNTGLVHQDMSGCSSEFWFKELIDPIALLTLSPRGKVNTDSHKVKGLLTERIIWIDAMEALVWKHSVYV